VFIEILDQNETNAIADIQGKTADDTKPEVQKRGSLIGSLSQVRPMTWLFTSTVGKMAASVEENEQRYHIC